MALLAAFTSTFLVGYLFGSLPTGYLAGRLFRGIDIREHGSLSTGATNVLRVLGPWPGALVLCIDFVKGLIPVWLAVSIADASLPYLSQTSMYALGPWLMATAGIATIIGHSRSIWLNFTGGKSAATGLGVLFAISVPVGLAASLAFILSLAVSRIVSLSSLIAAASAAVAALVFGEAFPFQLLIVSGAALVFVLHRQNIQRLFSGNEPMIGKSSGDPEP